MNTEKNEYNTYLASNIASRLVFGKHIHPFSAKFPPNTWSVTKVGPPTPSYNNIHYNVIL